jgi:hypothetical protein
VLFPCRADAVAVLPGPRLSVAVRPALSPATKIPSQPTANTKNLQLRAPPAIQHAPTIKPNRNNTTSITMARPKKVAEEKAKEGATLSIDVDSFVRTRDSVSLIPAPHSSSSSSQDPAHTDASTLSLKKYRHHRSSPTSPHISTTTYPTITDTSIPAFPHLRDPIPSPSRVAIS